MGFFSKTKETEGSEGARSAQAGLLQLLLQGPTSPVRGRLDSIPELYRTGWPTFDEQLAGPSNIEAMSLAGLENLASGRPSGAAGGQQFQQGRDVISQLLAEEPRDVEEYFRQTVEEPTLRAYEERILPAMRGQQVGGGQLFGSQQRGQENVQRRDLASELTRERTRTVFEERQRTTENKLRAMGAIGALSNAETAYLGNLLQLGATPREIQWAQTNFRLLEFNRRIQESRDRVSEALMAALQKFEPIIREGGLGRAGLEALAISSQESAGQSIGSWAGPGGALGGMCWVAAVYFGWHTPQWYAARNWLMRDWQSWIAPYFRHVYMRYGPAVARLAQRNRLVRAALKPLFEWAARKGE